MPDLDMIEKMALGTVKVTRQGFPLAFKLSENEMSCFKTAKVDGYIRCYSKRPNLKNIWLEYCEAIEWPYVFIDISSKSARVTMDLICHSGRLSLGALKALREEIWKAVPETNSWCYWGEIYTSVTSIPLDRADAVAKLLVKYGRLAIRLNEPEEWTSL